MGEAKRKALMQKVSGSETEWSPARAQTDAPRPVTRGESQTTPEPHGITPSVTVRENGVIEPMRTLGGESARERLNLSISYQLRCGLRAAAEALGMTESQIALQAIVAGLPQLAQQVRALTELDGGKEGERI